MNIKTTILALVALCTGACAEKQTLYDTQNVQNVTCEWNSKGQWTDWVKSVTIVPLETQGRNIVSDNALVYVHGADYYLVDCLQSGIVYRFDSLGSYKNSIGRIGSGPQEYLTLTDFQINDNGEIEIYSRSNNAKLKYQTDGTFLGKTNISAPFIKAISVQGDNYLYLGYNNSIGKGRIAKYDAQDKAEWYVLSAAPKVLMMEEITPVFSQNGDQIFVRETFNDTIFSIKNKKVEALYRFDFGSYAIVPEFWTQDNADQSTMKLLSSDFTTIKRFCENDAYSLVEIQLQKQDALDPLVGYGLQDKRAQRWSWFFVDKANDLQLLFANNVRALSSNNEVLLLVEPHQLLEIQDRSIISNPEVLEKISIDQNVAIVSCTLK